MAGGIRAPVGLAYVPGTDDLLVTMNQRDDLGDATPGDWLAIVRSGQSWGFPDCYGQGGAACAGVPGPIAELDPHAAVSGVAVVTGQLGPAIGTSAIVAEWATGACSGSRLERWRHIRGTVEPFLAGVSKPVPGRGRAGRSGHRRRLGRRARSTGWRRPESPSRRTSAAASRS